MSLSKTSRASLNIAAVLVAAVPLGAIADANDIATGTLPAVRLEPLAGEGAFRHLQALQDIATANGGNRAAGTPGYDRSAEYVAARLKEAGYTVRFEEFEFPFFEDRAPPVLVASEPGGEAAAAVRTLTNSGSGDLTGRLRAVNLQLGAGAAPRPARHRGRCSAGCEPCPSGQRGGATSVLARAARFFRAVWTKASSYGASHRNAGRGPLAAVADQQIR